MRYKKAGLPDGIFLVIALFVLAITFLLGFTVFSQINTQLQASDQISAQGKSMADDLITRYPKIFDNLFLFIVIGLSIGVIAGAWFIPSHPALFFISIPILAFIIWMGALYANIYSEFVADQNIAAFATSFPITVFIFEHYALIVTVIILMLALALYAKQRVSVG